MARRPTGIVGWAGLLALLLAAAPAPAQVAVSAYVDRTTLGDEETLLYVVEVTGPFREVGRVEAPDTRGLVALQPSPVQDWTTVRANGRQRQRLRLQWQFRPLRPGTARIGPAVVELDGQAYLTDPLTVQVVPQAQRPAPSPWTPSPPSSPRDAGPPPEAADLFLRAEPRTATAYVGEQVVVDYVLYFEAGVHPRNSRLASAWDAAGFWREELDLDAYLGSRTVTLDGRLYEAVPIKRLALFPMRAGRLTVDSLRVEVDVLRTERRAGRSGLFYNPFATRYERERLVAPPVVVEAEPLPPGAPPTFRGAVGQFGMAVHADRAEVEVGEPVAVTVALSGTGNLATLEGPSWEARPFEQYPPRRAEEIDRQAPRLTGEKRFTYTLVPRSGGTFALPPVVWTYFDPEEAAYRTLTSDSIRVRVIGPAAPLAEATPDAPPPDALVGPVEEATWVRQRARAPLWQRPWAWAAFGLPLLAFLGLLAARRLRDRDTDSPYARSLRAFPAAERGLREAEALRAAGQPRAFYAALERALHRFLADRLGTSLHGRSFEDAEAVLAERGVTEPTRRAVLDLLRASEQAQFGPTVTAPPTDAAEQAARLMAAVDAEAEALTPS